MSVIHITGSTYCYHTFFKAVGCRIGEFHIIVKLNGKMIHALFSDIGILCGVRNCTAISISCHCCRCMLIRDLRC